MRVIGERKKENKEGWKEEREGEGERKRKIKIKE
jgi:hypothetical protein